MNRNTCRKSKFYQCHFRKALLLNELIVFFNYNKLQDEKSSHIHKFVGPIIANMNIVVPNFYHQNEVIQIFNLQL